MIEYTKSVSKDDLGRPVELYNDCWYVCDIRPAKRPTGNTFSFTGAGMVRIPESAMAIVVLCREDESGAYLHEIAAHSIALDNTITHWGSGERISPEQCADLLARATTQETARAAARKQAIAESKAVQEALDSEINALRPKRAEALIVAEYEKDDSDSMTDYYGTVTTRRVALCWSRTKRDNFTELRKAAALFPETAFLAELGKDAERREKYAGGAGYYLKADSRYRDGWTVRKTWLGNTNGLEIELLRKPTPATPATPAGAVATGPNGAPDVQEHYNERKGFRYWLVVLPGRVDRQEFDTLLTSCKVAGGWYSRAWQGIPGGFAFKDESKARTWAAGVSVSSGLGDESTADRTPATPSPAVTLPQTLRDAADRLQVRIADAYRDRRENTPKQRKQATIARYRGQHLERAQTALRALADAHEAGTCPPVAAGVRTIARAETVTERRVMGGLGYYEYCESDEWADMSPEAVAVRELAGLVLTPEAARAREIQFKRDRIRNSHFEGFFPTPPDVAARMLELADIRPGHSVLEPSAGTGDLADVIQDAFPVVGGLSPISLTCCEICPTLAEVCAARHATIQGDFFSEFKPGVNSFDRIVMNPPFERGQEIEHVRHAFALLRPGGRIVSVMSPGPFFRSDRRSEEFGEWFDEAGGDKYELPAGSFKQSGTGIRTVLVVIDKAGE